MNLSNTTARLVPSRFRFAVPCRYREPLWTTGGLNLDETYRLTSFAELEADSSPIDVRAAWSEAGFGLAVSVQWKKRAPWCRESRFEDSKAITEFKLKAWEESDH